MQLRTIDRDVLNFDEVPLPAAGNEGQLLISSNGRMSTVCDDDFGTK